ncbi:MAG: lysostaphin resistance A-like protein [Candidatus Bruticola sp.]
MSSKRIILVTIALALWLPLVLPAFFCPSEEASWQKPFHANLEMRLAARLMRLGEKYHQPIIQRLTVAVLDSINFNQAQNSTVYGAAALYYLCLEKQKAINTLQNLNYEDTNSITEAMLSICKSGQLPIPDIQTAYFRLNLELKEAEPFYNDPLAAGYVVKMLKNNCPDSSLSQEMEADIQNKYQQTDSFIYIMAAWTCFIFVSLATVILLGLRKAYTKLISPKAGSEFTISEHEVTWKPIPVFYLFTTLSWLNAFLGAAILGLLLYTNSDNRTEVFPFALFFTQIVVYTVSIAALICLLKYVSSPSKLPTETAEQTEKTLSSQNEVPLGAENSAQYSADIESGSQPKTGFQYQLSYFAKTMGLHTFKKEYLILGMVGFAMAILTSGFMSTLTSVVTKTTTQSSNPILRLLAEAPTPVFILFSILVVVGPIYEEIIYRGLLFSGLRGAVSTVGAATVSSLMFSIMHGDPQGILVLGGLGAVFCALRHYSGSLWPSIIAHSTWNCQVAIYVLILAR